MVEEILGILPGKEMEISDEAIKKAGRREKEQEEIKTGREQTSYEKKIKSRGYVCEDTPLGPRFKMEEQ